MQFIKPGININFVGKRKIAFMLSLAMILISIASLVVHKGPKYGIDFAGGTLVQVKFDAPVKLADIKSGLATVNLDKSSVQGFGEHSENEYLIRTDGSVLTDQGFSLEVQKALASSTG
ncbi:MAG: protein translocase subunit SecF, partial [Desulfobacterales bacterium]|nr:protein translocase subunit SecF [Desulfobacterales bacterium]